MVSSKFLCSSEVTFVFAIIPLTIKLLRSFMKTFNVGNQICMHLITRVQIFGKLCLPHHIYKRQTIPLKELGK
jgi:hypothetical protein